MADPPSAGWRAVYEWHHCSLPTDDPDEQPGEDGDDDELRIETKVAELGSENRS